MQRRLIECMAKFVGFSFVVVLLTAAAALAQAQKPRPIANIPFDFFVGSQQLPAGHYEVEFSSPSVFLLHNLDNKSSNAQMFTLPEGPPLEPKDSKLVFFLREGKYLLAGVAGANGKQRLSMYYGMSPGKRDVREEVRLELR